MEQEGGLVKNIQKKLKRRFKINKKNYLLKRYAEKAVYKVLQTMIRRGEIQHRAQRKLLFRVK